VWARLVAAAPRRAAFLLFFFLDPRGDFCMMAGVHDGMTPQLYAHLALCLGTVLFVIDVAWFYKKRGWYVAWTHWNYAVMIVYFIGVRTGKWPTAQPEIQTLAWGGTLSVNAGYWLLLFPRRRRRGTASFATLTPPSIAKHGGTVLWLLGYTIASGEELPRITGMRLAGLTAWPCAYVLFSIARHRRTGKWVYGKFFAFNQVRLVFCLAPSLCYVAGSFGVTWVITQSTPTWVPALLLAATPVHFVLGWRAVKAKVWAKND